MSRFQLILITLISMLLISCGIALWAAVSNDDDEDVKVPISDVPAKVLDAANSKVPGGEITEVEKDVEKGVTIYDVVKMVDGVKYEIEVTADGVVNEVEKGDEDTDGEKVDDGEDKDEVVPLSDVPDAVVKAAKEAVPDGIIKQVEKEEENGEAVYEVKIIVKHEVKVKANGEVIKVSKDSDQEDDDKENGDNEKDDEDDD